MILPIVAFGSPVLKKLALEIDENYPELDNLIDNMWATMDKANGVGLAAPQIGKSIRLFLIDSTLMQEEGEEDLGTKEVFINAKIVEETGKLWDYEEGCLSIPDVRANVERHETIKITYYNANWELQEKTFDGLTARVIQHEYDHIEGVLFTDYLKPLKKRMLNKRLTKISKGDIRIGYKMKFPQ